MYAHVVTVVYEYMCTPPEYKTGCTSFMNGVSIFIMYTFQHKTTTGAQHCMVYKALPD